jgi:2-methylcitrate dehydratase PrpD
MEAALILRAKNKFDVEDIAEITAIGANYSVDTPAARAPGHRPKTPRQARGSTNHPLAEALVLGKIDKTSFLEPNLRNPQINAVADKVYVRPDPKWNDVTRSGGTLVIKFKDRRELSHTIEDMRGTALNPNTQADYVAKVRRNAEGVVSSGVIDKTITNVLCLEKVHHVAEVLGPLSKV